MSELWVNITAYKDKASAKPTGYLGDAFGAYRAACASAAAKWHPETSSNVLDVKKVPILASSLRDAGFQVHVDPALAVVATALGADAQQRQVATARRIQAALPRLAAAGVKNYRQYQKDGSVWLAGRKTAHLSDDMGLGKTPQAFMAIEEGARVFWWCPASLKFNVRLEGMKKWRPDFRYKVLSGGRSFRWPEPGEVVISNYDILPGELETYGKQERRRVKVGSICQPPPGPPVYLIADEDHAVKSSKATRTLRLRALVKAVLASGGFAWGMSGTELLNAPAETWNILETYGLGTEAFGSFARYMNLMGGFRGSFGIEWGDAVDPSVPALLRKVSLKRMKRDVMKELPPKQYSSVVVDVDDQTKVICDQVITALKGMDIDLNEIHSVVQLSKGGAGFELFSKAMTALAVSKCAALLEIVEQYEESGQPLVVFSAHRAPVDMLEKREGWGVVQGDMNPAQKQAVVEAFQAGKLRGIAGTIRSMGVGFNLTRASHMLRVDRDFTPALNAQAEDRINRHGQEADSLLITDLIADHLLDHRLTEILLGKSSLIAASTEAAALGEHERPIDPRVFELAEAMAPAVAAPSAQQPTKEQTIEERHRHLAARAVKEAIEIFDGKLLSAPEDLMQVIRANSAPAPAPEPPAARRQAKTAAERWAAAGMVAIAGVDRDHALVRNEAGFSKFDGEFGHRMALRVQSGRGLTDKEWSAIVELAQKYRKQLPPLSSSDSHATQSNSVADSLGIS